MNHTRLGLLFVLALTSVVSLSTIRAQEDGQLLKPSPLNITPRQANAATKQTPSKSQSKLPAPETIVKNLVVAWNQGDAASIAKLFLPDGVLVTPTGSVVRSRSEIQKTIVKERQGRLKETMLTNTVEDVSLVDANTAVVKGQYLIDGVKILGVKTSAEGFYIFRHKKHQGRWMIAKAEVHRKKSE